MLNFLVLVIVVAVLWRPLRRGYRWLSNLLFHSKSRGTLAYTCAALVCVVWLFSFAAEKFFETDTGRFLRNLYVTIGETTTWLEQQITADQKEAKGNWKTMDELKFVNSLDPNHERVLINNVSLGGTMVETEKQTIQLKASRTRVRPGTRVNFEATPSPETPRMGSRILLLCNPMSHTTTLSRWWFVGKTYRGSFKFKKTDSGLFKFSIMAPPQVNREKEEETWTVHSSNTVSVVVEPDPKELSRIYLWTPTSTFIPITENTTEIVSLFAKSKDGAEYDISPPGMGVIWEVEDESKAIVAVEEYQGQTQTVLKGFKPGETKLTAIYHGFQTTVRLFVAPDDSKFIPNKSLIEDWNIPPRRVSPPLDVVMSVGETIELTATPFESSTKHLLYSQWRIIDQEKNKFGARAASNQASWTPTKAGAYLWSMRYILSEGVTTPWTQEYTIAVRPALSAATSYPVKGAIWEVDDESKAAALEKELNERRQAALENPQPEETPPPPMPDRPYAISPPEGAVVRKYEKVVLEISSFDISKGHKFEESEWHVYAIKENGKQGRSIAGLNHGNSNIAEWYPRKTGTFEWVGGYYYGGISSNPGYEAYYASPVRIVVEE